MERSSFDPSEDGMDSETLKQRFSDDLRDERERAEGTIKQYLYRLAFAEERIGKPIQDVSADDLRGLRNRLRQKGYSSSHVKGIIVAARAFHKWGMQAGLWEGNGILLLPTPKEVNFSTPPLSHRRARAVLDSCEGSLETRVVYLGLYAGTRVGESAAITDEAWDDGWLRFRHEKSGLAGEVPVHNALKAKRDLILAHSTPHKEALQNAKQRIEQRVGFRFVTHQLRKAFASTLYDANVDDRVIKTLLGHKQDVTSLYIVVSQRRKQEAIQRLTYSAPDEELLERRRRHVARAP